MKIRKATKKDIIEIQNLVCKTFKKCNFNEGSKKGVQDYLDWHNPKKNLEKLKETFLEHEISFVAVEGNKIVGIIRGKRSKIRNLFVDPKYHKKGMAKKLMERFEKEAKKLNSNEIRLRSSLYAAPFYEKMGYKKTTGIRNFGGIDVWPMRKKLNLKIDKDNLLVEKKL